MTYYESAEDEKISYAMAMRELYTRSAYNIESVREFLKALGDKALYSVQEVLDWLGY